MLLEKGERALFNRDPTTCLNKVTCSNAEKGGKIKHLPICPEELEANVPSESIFGCFRYSGLLLEKEQSKQKRVLHIQHI